MRFYGRAPLRTPYQLEAEEARALLVEHERAEPVDLPLTTEEEAILISEDMSDGEMAIFNSTLQACRLVTRHQAHLQSAAAATRRDDNAKVALGRLTGDELQPEHWRAFAERQLELDRVDSPSADQLAAMCAEERERQHDRERMLSRMRSTPTAHPPSVRPDRVPRGIAAPPAPTGLVAIGAEGPFFGFERRPGSMTQFAVGNMVLYSDRDMAGTAKLDRCHRREGMTKVLRAYVMVKFPDALKSIKCHKCFCELVARSTTAEHEASIDRSMAKARRAR